MRTVSTSSSRQSGLGFNWDGWRRGTAPSMMMLAFFTSFALAAIVIVLFGAEERGTVLALRVTARWSFVLFWFAYTGGALATLFGSRLHRLASKGRELGLAFASAQLIHIILVLWLYRMATEPVGAMTFFWLGTACLYTLALFSVPRVRNVVEPHIWRAFRTMGLEYIALVFAVDFIIGPLRAGEGRYPWSYMPFALMLVGGVCLRAAALATGICSRQARMR